VSQPKLHIVTGKGGVGKTRCSILLSERLGIESLVGKKSDLERENNSLGVSGKIFLEISNRELLEALLEEIIPFKKIADWASASSLLQNIVFLAPQLDQLLLLYELLKKSTKESILYDGPSTGNFKALLDAAPTAQRMFRSGKLKTFADQILKEMTRICVWNISLPENSALHESQEISDYLKEFQPQIKERRVLNRCHQKPQIEGFDWEQPWRDFAFTRPERELERTRKISYEFRALEGDRRL